MQELNISSVPTLHCGACSHVTIGLSGKQRKYISTLVSNCRKTTVLWVELKGSDRCGGDFIQLP